MTNPGNRFDFLEVFSSTISSLIGRLFAVFLAASVGSILGGFVMMLWRGAAAEDFLNLIGAPFVAGFFLSLTGILLYFPLQFFCALLFGRYELPNWFLLIPCVLGIWAGLNFGEALVE